MVEDLISYQASGEPSTDGTVVIIEESLASDNLKTLSAEVISGEAESIYIKMDVTPSAHSRLGFWERDWRGIVFKCFKNLIGGF